MPPEDRTLRRSRYKPNQVPLWDRVKYTALAVLLLAAGSLGLWKDDISFRILKARYGGKIYHLHGTPAFMMFAGYLFVSLALLSLVVDHYDKRNNEKSYQLFFALSAGTAIIWIAFAIMFGG
jgi:hypothetical protein